ncbi:cryptochrome/photolyase family protein [Phytoactinopolyspora halotolerans]|uniref:Deoxyribodipyrimidine photo-lyase n=1 Tax=Phytoactinopolyspora halotolerans TaxID=1981512 RepID=A0A6L9SA18_9ACTN|nr:deoxyribodipyrimidine photo-lyase [Phytoactinopolyspora halotolerans]NEE01927.1 deoxyribodipyrimidine photo-lyase [Phytoactinopolyspora halotolerans]
MTTTTVAVFTRDLRVHDNPMLAAAARADHVVPLFVRDRRVENGTFAAGRARFLDQCLTDLDAGLRELGGRLVVRSGDPVEEICRLAAEVDAERVHLSRDVSAYAGSRERSLVAALGRRVLHVHDDVHTVVPPGRILPQGNDHFAVFTPYHRRWIATRWRDPVPAPRHLSLPPGAGRTDTNPDGPTADVERRGETAGVARTRSWLDTGIDAYEQRHDDLAADGTSRLSPYLHLGCVSPLLLARRAAAAGTDGAAAFARQLAWRDFHHQVLAARPDTAHADYRPRADRWNDDADGLDAWREGQTGIPIVDAGMRQLRAEGWMHNRARLITGSFLTKTLYIDWRAGARHFFTWLLDGDIANNCLNWQWVAGTGTDTRPNRVLNPIRQAQRYDPDGAYVRRYVPELAHLSTADVHQPWRLPERERRGYPAPIVDLAEARTRFLAARHGGAG